jgi:hypothetical protein
MNLKLAYTKIFIQDIEEALSEANIKERLDTIWQNTRADGGLRLTDEGYMFLTERVDLKEYDIPFPRDMEFTSQVYIFLDNFIDCPYYLTKNSIVVFSEKKSIELMLFSGDVKKFGIIKAINKQKTENSG